MIKALVWLVLLLGVLAFAVQGGEYRTTDLLQQRVRKRTLVASIDTLQRDVDSLSRLQKRLDTDSVLQERIAREEFGMVRGDKELLYRFTTPTPTRDTTDTTAQKPSDAASKP